MAAGERALIDWRTWFVPAKLRLLAAPVFHNVMEGALRLMDVPPDDIETWLAAQAKAQAAAAKAGGANSVATVSPPAARGAALPAPLPEPAGAQP